MHVSDLSTAPLLWLCANRIVLLRLLNMVSVTPTIFAELPVGIYSKEKHSDQAVECCVCLEDFEEGEHMLVLPCNHFFHAACITQWFQGRNCCPLCKHVVVSATSCVIGSSSEALQAAESNGGWGRELTILHHNGAPSEHSGMPDETESGMSTLNTGVGMHH